MGFGGVRGSIGSHGGGGNQRRHRRRCRAAPLHAHWGDASECASSGFDSFYETSSSDNDIVNPKRNRALDSVLFDYFSKQAICSLKRDLSKLCSEYDFLRESKRPKLHSAGRDAFSVYHSKYFFKVLNQLTLEQKAIIQKFGFGCLLCLSKTQLPSSFIRWLALCVDPMCSEINAGDKSLLFRKEAFHFILGFSNSGSPLVDDSVGGLEFILSLFNLPETPHITFFGNKLTSGDHLSEKQIFACFMQVAISCFLCPSKSETLDTNYISQLGDPERARRFDLCMLVHSHTMTGVSKTVNYIQSKGRKPKVFEFCSYALAVYYLDCLDFGVHVAGSGVPRSVSWRGDMIKTYSDLDRIGRKGFGRRRMRKDLAGCYSHVTNATSKCCSHCASHDEGLSARQKETMIEKFTSVLPTKVIDDIFNSVHLFYSSSMVNANSPGVLVHNILHALANARLCFQLSGHNQKENVQSSFANLSVSALANTPGSTANKTGQELVITAPELHPLKKVMSRLTVNAPAFLNSDSLSQDDLISPIGRIKLSPFTGGKVTMKPDATTAVNNRAAKSQVGSMQTPIPVGDTTPKAILPVKSPDVTITHTSSLKQRHSKLAIDTEAAYNKSLRGKNVSFLDPSRKAVFTAPIKPSVIVVDDDKCRTGAVLQNPLKDSSSSNRIIIQQPKQCLALPLEHNPRFPVSDEDIMHYCAIIDLAYIEKTQRDYALKYHGVHCSFVSLGQTLMPDGHIDNFLIPCLCRKLFEDKHPSKSGRHYFFSYIGESILNYDIDNDVTAMVRTSFIGASTASKGKRLELSDRLFFPICKDEHWFTFCVDFKWKLFVFLDSLFSPDSDFQRSVQGRLKSNFVSLWSDIFPTDETDFSKFRTWNGNIPKQGNSHDCGVMTMMAMEFYDPPKNLCHLFSKEDIPHIRIQYANRLFFHGGNKVDMSIVTNFYDKDAFMPKLH